MTLLEIISHCKCGVYLTVNQHRDYYKTTSQFIDELFDNDRVDKEDIPDELKKRMIETNSIVHLQWYPETPVGFNNVYGASLEEVIEKASKYFE